MNPRGIGVINSINFALRAKLIQFSVATTVAVLRSPLFLKSFFLILPLKSSRTDSKRGCKKMGGRTNTQNLARSGGRRDPVLDLRNGSPLASSLQKWIQNKLADSLNNPIKEHLRLLCSLALSSSCAFGAIKPLDMASNFVILH